MHKIILRSLHEISRSGSYTFKLCISKQHLSGHSFGRGRQLLAHGPPYSGVLIPEILIVVIPRHLWYKVPGLKSS